MMTDPQTLLSLALPGLLQLRAQEAPDAVALSANSPADGRVALTYAQLVERMWRHAGHFARNGISDGDRVGVFLTNDAGLECFLSALGVIALGGVIVPLNTRYADREIGHALTLAEPAAVVTAGESVGRLRGIMPGLRMFQIGSDIGADCMGWSPEPGESFGGTPSSDPDQLACLLFTSGTTARAKAVMHTHRTMIGAGLCCSRALGLVAGDLYQAGWPFFTSSALNLGGMSSWVAGGGFVFEELLDNAGRLRLVEQAGTTFYHGVPSVVHFLTDELEAGDYDLSRVRRVGYGGSAMPPELVIRIEKAWAPAIQVQIYGLTESGPTGLVMPPEYLHEKMGAVGRAMPFTEIRIEDPEGRPLGSGQFGEIVVESPGVAVGYYRNPEASAAVFKGRSVRSGDGGIMDEDGFVRFTDRIKDMINRGGLKISSVAVEAVLYEHPNVKEAAAVAVHHPALGEDVAACVVPQNGARLSPAELSAFCKDKLADYEQPRHWFILDELVKNPMGKILKRELRAYAEEQLSRRNEAEAIRN